MKFCYKCIKFYLKSPILTGVYIKMIYEGHVVLIQK
jgi:hypothetical protein